jgi:hypothetical protein
VVNAHEILAAENLVKGGCATRQDDEMQNKNTGHRLVQVGNIGVCDVCCNIRLGKLRGPTLGCKQAAAAHAVNPWLSALEMHMGCHTLRLVASRLVERATWGCGVNAAVMVLCSFAAALAACNLAICNS